MHRKKTLVVLSCLFSLLASAALAKVNSKVNDSSEQTADTDQATTIYYKQAHKYALGIDYGYAWQSQFPSQQAIAIDPKRGWYLQGSFNRSFKRRFTLQLAYALSHSDTHKPGDGDYNTYSLMLNTLMNLYKVSSSVPFIAAGVGYAKINISAGGDSKIPQQISDSSNWTFAYQFGVGVQEILTKHLVANMTYWYMRTKPTLIFNGKSYTGMNAKHSLSLGLVYQF